MYNEKIKFVVLYWYDSYLSHCLKVIVKPRLLPNEMQCFFLETTCEVFVMKYQIRFIERIVVSS